MEINGDLMRIKEMINDNVAIGNIIIIDDNLKLIPIFKVKINYMFLDKGSDKAPSGSNANINVIPLGFLQIKNSDVKVISLNPNAEIVKNVPNILESLSETFNIADLFKNFDKDVQN